MSGQFSRRTFLQSATGATLLVTASASSGQSPAIQGFEDKGGAPDSRAAWHPVSDRKVRVGIVGYGVCKFGAAFGFQDHPNVEIVAVSDLFPDRCAELAKVCRCAKTYPSLEELVKVPDIEAVFVATDAPSHARHCIEVLKHGKHAACAVPAVFGDLEDADRLYDAVQKSGLKYMMFETSAFHDDCYAMRQLYQMGTLGKLTYAEGEYFHYMETPIDSYKGWRIGLPPQWYPTHSNAYYSCVTLGRYTEVSCAGVPSMLEHLQPANNRYQNAFGTEIALLRTSDGGAARMAVSWDTPGYGGEVGRIRGQRGSVQGLQLDGLDKVDPESLRKPALPPGMDPGGHGGSHGYLCNEFITAIIEDRTPLVNIGLALNMTAAGIQAHHSARKDGETFKVPHWD